VLDYPLPTELLFSLDGSLDAVVTTLSLRVLRLVWAPGNDGSEPDRNNGVWLKRAAETAYSFAPLVLIYLWRSGSFIRILALSDELRWHAMRGDSNLYFYLYYYKLVETRGGGKILPLKVFVAESLELGVLR
jgi:hypothetical protein